MNPYVNDNMACSTPFVDTQSTGFPAQLITNISIDIAVLSKLYVRGLTVSDYKLSIVITDQSGNVLFPFVDLQANATSSAVNYTGASCIITTGNIQQKQLSYPNINIQIKPQNVTHAPKLMSGINTLYIGTSAYHPGQLLQLAFTGALGMDNSTVFRDMDAPALILCDGTTNTGSNSVSAINGITGSALLLNVDDIGSAYVYDSCKCVHVLVDA